MLKIEVDWRFWKTTIKERLLAEAKEMRKDMKAEVSAAELIREDRDAG